MLGTLVRICVVYLAIMYQQSVKASIVVLATDNPQLFSDYHWVQGNGYMITGAGWGVDAIVTVSFGGLHVTCMGNWEPSGGFTDGGSR